MAHFGSRLKFDEHQLEFCSFGRDRFCEISLSFINQSINHGSGSLLLLSFDQEKVFNDEDQLSSEYKLWRWKVSEVHKLLGGKFQVAKEKSVGFGEQRHEQD